MTWGFGSHLLTCCHYLNLLAQIILGAWKSVSQTIPSLSVSSNSDKVILLIKHILHIFLQCVSFAVACSKSSLWTIYSSHEVFSQPELRKDWLFSYFICIHRLWLVFRFALCEVHRQLYVHCFCLFRSFHPFSWSHQFGIQGDAICTILTKRIPYTFKWSFAIFDAGQVSWMLDSVHDTCETKTWMPNVCPKVHPACGPLQPMQVPSAYRHVFLSNLIYLGHL